MAVHVIEQQTKNQVNFDIEKYIRFEIIIRTWYVSTKHCTLYTPDIHLIHPKWLNASPRKLFVELRVEIMESAFGSRITVLLSQFRDLFYMRKLLQRLEYHFHVMENWNTSEDFTDEWRTFWAMNQCSRWIPFQNIRNELIV